MEENKKNEENRDDLEAHNQINKLVMRLRENNESLHISRVPKNIKIKFMDLANSEFCGDYGMLLKFLVDGLINQDVNILISKIEEIESKIELLESENSKEDVEDSSIKMLDGSKKAVRRFN